MLLRFPLWNGYNFAVIKFLRFKHKQFVIIKYGVTRTVVKTLSKRCQGAVNAFTEISVILTPFTWQRDDYALATRSGSAVRKRHSVVYNSYYSKDSQSVIFRLAYYTADFAYDMDRRARTERLQNVLLTIVLAVYEFIWQFLSRKHHSIRWRFLK